MARPMLTFVVVVVLCFSSAAYSAGEKAQNGIPAPPGAEFRGVWVSSYGPDADLVTPKNIDELVAHAKLANLNALIVQVRKTGDALYKSSYEPRAENLTLPDFDPLEYIIKKAHAAGLEVHAWLNTYKIWAGTTPPKSPEHVFNKHPEWINKSIAGQLDKSRNYALDPGIREAQEYTFNVYMDCVRKYDIDGIHFDYVRYWDNVYGYSDLAVARFNKETGNTGVPKPTDPEWSQWRRDRVTDLVRQVYTAVKKTKPHVKVTAAVICSQACTPKFENTHPFKRLLQDWERWLREGIVDAVIPMNYKSERNPALAKLFREWTDAMVRWRHGRHAYNGMYVRDTDSLITQIKESRKRGTDGVVGFAFNRGSRRAGVAAALRKGVFATWGPTPPMPWKPARKSGGPEKPAGPKELLDRAVRCLSEGNDVDRAIALLEQAVELDINFVEAHLQLGRCYVRKGMVAEAVEEFRETLEIDALHEEAQRELRKIEGGE